MWRSGLLYNPRGSSTLTGAEPAMPFADVTGVKLFYEETGEGAPLVFVHEFAGDHQSWHLQVRFFSRRYRTIAYNARGYPPSDVPEDGSGSILG